jgi:diguanylate cyclase (GGDEF)-like protein
MTQIHCLSALELDRFLARRRAGLGLPIEFHLADNLANTLRRIHEIIPCRASAVLLDNPASKLESSPASELTVIAAGGETPEDDAGRGLPIDGTFAGAVYRSGESRMSLQQDVPELGSSDHSGVAKRDLLAVPIRIEHEVCGVVELVDRFGIDGFSSQDLDLLQVFADYLSLSIQSVLDNRQAQEIAKKDNLTGLFNDRYLHIALSRAIERCLQADDDLAVLFLDLDFFKRVNDTHGHLTGSQVLREVGGLLAQTATAPGTIAARYGGDEFVLVIPGLDLDAAIDLAEEIRTRVLLTHYCSEPGELQAETIDLSGQTCSIGVATLRRHITEELPVERIKSNLLRLADAAMYVAKETGRNRTAVAGSPVRRR